MDRFVSREFPEGYGDIAIVTRDNWVFHFPRFLLSHTSPVLRDTLQSQNYSTDNPLRVNEDRATMDILFHHIDPAKPTPELDRATLYGVLEARRKYQINDTWLGDQLIARDNTVNSFVREKPMLILSIGEDFDKEKIARVALRELIMVDTTQLMSPPSWERFELLLGSRRYPHKCNRCYNDVQSLVCSTKPQPPTLNPAGGYWGTGYGMNNSPYRNPSPTGFGSYNSFGQGTPSIWPGQSPQLQPSTGFLQNQIPYQAPHQFQPQLGSTAPASAFGNHGNVPGTLIVDYESVKKIIQQKEAELPELPQRSPSPAPAPTPSPAPVYKPVQPFFSF
ncbi:hypothetical protein FRC17_007185 [Serendipita sp. 399]|nr:hypothetical protein FRC17_007185 [Serendipita sp. 399]